MKNPPDQEAGISEKQLIRAQAGSGVVFASFLALHLLNTVVASLGQEAYDSVQRAFRWYYQFPLIEVVVVLAAAGLHIVVSVIRIRRRHDRAPASVSLKTRLHRFAGYYLLVMFSGHLGAARLPPLLAGTPIDFSFVNFSLSYWPFFFVPYYLLLGVSGVVHLSLGFPIAMRVLGVRSPVLSREANWGVIAFLSVAAVLAVFAFWGAFAPVNQGRFPEFQALYEGWAPAGFLPWKAK